MTDDDAEDNKKVITTLAPTPLITSTDIPGAFLRENFITVKEERSLIKMFDNSEWLLNSMYRYQEFKDELPEWANVVINRLLSWEIIDFTPNNMVIRDFAPGQGISPICEDDTLYSDGIIIILLGCSVPMLFEACENKRAKKEIYVPKCSVLSLFDKARYQWRHGLSPRKADKKVRRERILTINFKKRIS